MATINKNLSEYDATSLPSMTGKRVAIVVSEWNDEITKGLLKGALEVLHEAKMDDKNIIIKHVPGTYELPLAAALCLDYERVDGVIAIGSVIRGETAHFDFVCQAAAQGIKDVGLKFQKPVIFCVLTDDNIEQSRARSGGEHGNKGTEAAVACVKMIGLQKDLSGSWGAGFKA
jgi:6,7-dimethyl-8-ribityllumazine synthase